MRVIEDFTTGTARCECGGSLETVLSRWQVLDALDSGDYEYVTDQTTMLHRGLRNIITSVKKKRPTLRVLAHKPSTQTVYEHPNGVERYTRIFFLDPHQPYFFLGSVYYANGYTATLPRLPKLTYSGWNKVDKYKTRSVNTARIVTALNKGLKAVEIHELINIAIWWPLEYKIEEVLGSGNVVHETDRALRSFFYDIARDGTLSLPMWEYIQDVESHKVDGTFLPPLPAIEQHMKVAKEQIDKTKSKADMLKGMKPIALLVLGDENDPEADVYISTASKKGRVYKGKGAQLPTRVQSNLAVLMMLNEKERGTPQGILVESKWCSVVPFGGIVFTNSDSLLDIHEEWELVHTSEDK